MRLPAVVIKHIEGLKFIESFTTTQVNKRWLLPITAQNIVFRAFHTDLRISGFMRGEPYTHTYKNYYLSGHTLPLSQFWNSIQTTALRYHRAMVRAFLFEDYKILTIIDTYEMAPSHRVRWLADDENIETQCQRRYFYSHIPPEGAMQVVKELSTLTNVWWIHKKHYHAYPHKTWRHARIAATGEVLRVRP